MIEAFVDEDGDGYGTSARTIRCPLPDGYAVEGGDCDDTRAEVHPGATELCDGLDDDCDGTDGSLEDMDGDGYAPRGVDCDGGPIAHGDCNDASAAEHPGGVEVCDGLDNDCDGTVDGPDATATSCAPVSGYVVECSEASCLATACAGAPGCDPAVGMGLGLSSSCVVRASGALSCFGSNGKGQLGDETTTDRHDPVEAVGVDDAVGVALGWWSTCVRHATGAVSCVGDNRYGQLGDGTTTDRRSWVDVAGLTDAIDIDGGRMWYGGSGSHTCALRAGGTIVCWGSNVDGQLGDGTTVSSSTPVPVTGLATAVDVEVGCGNTCALLASGRVECWGGMWSWVTGMVRHTTPYEVAGITTATQISLNGLHACARLVDGSVSCWGSNTSGQLGDGTLTSRATPASVFGLSDAVAVSTSDTFTCALRESGAVVCWGDNASGQLGDGTTVSHFAPAHDVVGIADALAVETGSTHACALRPGGAVWCWGRDGNGELGNGLPLTGSTTPVAVRLHEP